MQNEKENFCGACVVVPLAMSGLGLTEYSSTSYKWKKRIMLIILCITIIILLYIYQKCDSCHV